MTNPLLGKRRRPWVRWHKYLIEWRVPPRIAATGHIQGHNGITHSRENVGQNQLWSRSSQFNESPQALMESIHGTPLPVGKAHCLVTPA